MNIRLHAVIAYAVGLGLWAAEVPVRGADDKGAAPAAPKPTAAALLAQAAGNDEAQAADARKQLAAMGTDGLPALIAAIDSKEATTRDAAVAVLESMVDMRAVKPLAGLLGHANTRVSHAAACALRRFGAPAAEELAAALAGSAKAAHFPAAYALSGIGTYTKADPWLAALKSEDGRVRYYAAAALGASTDARAVDALRKAADDREAHVRQTAAAALAKVEAAPRAGAEAPEDAAAETARYQAAMAAWKDGSPESVDLLIRGLQDRSMRIRAHCAWALGRLGNARGVEPLIRVIEVPVDPQQVSYAAKALAQITGQDFGPDARAWRQWYEKESATNKGEETR